MIKSWEKQIGVAAASLSGARFTQGNDIPAGLKYAQSEVRGAGQLIKAGTDLETKIWDFKARADAVQAMTDLQNEDIDPLTNNQTSGARASEKAELKPHTSGLKGFNQLEGSAVFKDSEKIKSDYIGTLNEAALQKRSKLDPLAQSYFDEAYEAKRSAFTSSLNGHIAQARTKYMISNTQATIDNYGKSLIDAAMSGNTKDVRTLKKLISGQIGGLSSLTGESPKKIQEGVWDGVISIGVQQALDGGDFAGANRVLEESRKMMSTGVYVQLESAMHEKARFAANTQAGENMYDRNEGYGSAAGKQIVMRDVEGNVVSYSKTGAELADSLIQYGVVQDDIINYAKEYGVDGDTALLMSAIGASFKGEKVDLSQHLGKMKEKGGISASLKKLKNLSPDAYANAVNIMAIAGRPMAEDKDLLTDKTKEILAERYKKKGLVDLRVDALGGISSRHNSPDQLTKDFDAHNDELIALKNKGYEINEPTYTVGTKDYNVAKRAYVDRGMATKGQVVADLQNKMDVLIEDIIKNNYNLENKEIASKLAALPKEMRDYVIRIKTEGVSSVTSKALLRNLTTKPEVMEATYNKVKDAQGNIDATKLKWYFADEDQDSAVGLLQGHRKKLALPVDTHTPIQKAVIQQINTLPVIRKLGVILPSPNSEREYTKSLRDAMNEIHSAKPTEMTQEEKDDAMEIIWGTIKNATDTASQLVKEKKAVTQQAIASNLATEAQVLIQKNDTSFIGKLASLFTGTKKDMILRTESLSNVLRIEDGKVVIGGTKEEQDSLLNSKVTLYQDSLGGKQKISVTLGELAGRMQEVQEFFRNLVEERKKHFNGGGVVITDKALLNKAMVMVLTSKK